MTLFGWSDISPQDISPEVTIARMFGSPERAQSLKLNDPPGALAVDAEHGISDCGDDRDVASAIIGNPQWDEPALAAIATGNGHAAALNEAYRRYGEGFFRHLHGAFALAVVARAPRRVLVAVDREQLQAEP